MSDAHDRFEHDSGHGFVMGLLTGTVLGAGLGILFAPKTGSALRHDISERAGSLAHTASDGYRRASETAGQWAAKGRDVGREVYDRTRQAVNRGAEEAERYVKSASETASSAAGPMADMPAATPGEGPRSGDSGAGRARTTGGSRAS
jgi:gas vesicle protein